MALLTLTLHTIVIKFINFSSSYSSCDLDGHWRPFLSKCAYCTAPYTVIARLETLQEDLHFLGEMAGVKFDSGTASKPSSGGSDRARLYFGQLTRGVVWQLYQLYWVDFQMFGYTHTMYADMAIQ